MNPSTSNPTVSKSLANPNPTSSSQKRTFTSSTSYRDQSSNQAANSSSPPPASSSSPLHHSSSSPPISPTFDYARTSSSNSSFADPLAANAKVFSSKSASFSRRDSRVGRAATTTVGSGNGRLESSDEDGMYLEPGSPSSGRGNRALTGIGGAKSSNRGKKRSLPVSPQQSQTTTSLNRHFGNQRSSPGDDDDIFSSSRLMPPPSSNSISLDSHKSVLGGQEKWIAPSSSNQQDSVLAAGFYGSSDNTSASEDVNSSSDDAMDYGKPDKEGDVGPNNTSFPKNVNVGLGLEAAFEEKIKPQNPFAKAKSFQRWGSDPHSAFGALPSNSTSTTSSSGSSSNQNHHHPSQRRRLTGSSPKKLTRARNSSRFGNITAENVEMEIQQDTSEDSMFEDNDQHQQRLPSLIEAQTAFWRNVVSDAVGIDVGISGSSFKNSRSTLDASSKDLQFIHPCIADLKTYVQLAPPPPPDKIESSSTSSPRSNNHNNSKDSSTFEEDPHSVRNRQFAASLDRTRSSTFSRTTTPQNAQQALNGSPSLVNGHSNPSSPAGNGLNRTISNKAPLPSYEHLTLTLAQNQLSSLPSALFEVTKLTVLSLRNNKLRTLPPAISELRSLRELSIGANELSYLPSEILKLNNLTNFTYHPNPWMRAPPESQLSVRPLLGSTAWRLVASSKRRASRTRQEDSNSTSIASHPSTLSASTPPHPVNTEASKQLMGPPALPLHIQANRARMLERTVSDAQVDDLLARGGGLGSIGTTTTTNGSSSLLPDPSPFPCEGRARYLSPVEIGLNPIPSLRELCIRSLLSPQPISINSPTINRSRNKILLDKYENGVLRKCKGLLYVETMRVLEVARRSSSGVWGSSSSSSFGSSSIPNSRTFSRTVSGSSRTSRASKSNNNSKEKANWCSETRLTDHSNRSSDIDPDSMESDDADLSDLSTGDIGGKSNSTKIENTIAPIDVEASLDNGDDASKNPFFSRCPNPYHHFDPSSPSLNKSSHSLNQGEEENDWPIERVSEPFSSSTSSTSSGPIFWEPVEVRYEWVSHIAGQKVASSKQLKTTFTGMEPQVEVEDSTLADQTNGNGVGNSSDVDRTITEENSESRKPKSNGPLVDGSGCLPIQWRGCSKGCLNFLDEVEE